MRDGEGASVRRCHEDLYWRLVHVLESATVAGVKALLHINYDAWYGVREFRSVYDCGDVSQRRVLLL